MASLSSFQQGLFGKGRRASGPPELVTNLPWLRGSNRGDLESHQLDSEQKSARSVLHSVCPNLIRFVDRKLGKAVQTPESNALRQPRGNRNQAAS